MATHTFTLDVKRERVAMVKFETEEEEHFWTDVYLSVLHHQNLSVHDACQKADASVEELRARSTTLEDLIGDGGEPPEERPS